MIKTIISLLVLLMLNGVFAGCSAKKKSYSEMRGLMLLENTQIGRNKGYYSKHKSKRVSKAHQRMKKTKKDKF